MSRLLNILLALSVVLTSRALEARPRPLQPAGAADSFVTDEHGRRFRGAFPPHDRLWLGLGLGVRDGESTAELSFGWRFTLHADFPDEEIWWQLRHELLSASYRLGARRLRVELLAADYLRHDMSSWVLIPAKRDVRLPAPYDISLQYALGAVELEGERVDQVDVGRLAVLADFIRDPNYRTRLAFGFEARYAARRETDSWSHDVTPLSSIVGVWSWEERRGLFTVSLRPQVGREAHMGTSGRATWNWRSSLRVESEWVPIAINDAPLSLVAAAELGRRAGVPIEWDVGAGLKWAWSSRP